MFLFLRGCRNWLETRAIYLGCVTLWWYRSTGNEEKEFELVTLFTANSLSDGERPEISGEAYEVFEQEICGCGHLVFAE